MFLLFLHFLHPPISSSSPSTPPPLLYMRTLVCFFSMQIFISVEKGRLIDSMFSAPLSKLKMDWALTISLPRDKEISWTLLCLSSCVGFFFPFFDSKCAPLFSWGSCENEMPLGSYKRDLVGKGCSLSTRTGGVLGLALSRTSISCSSVHVAMRTHLLHWGGA